MLRLLNVTLCLSIGASMASAQTPQTSPQRAMELDSKATQQAMKTLSSLVNKHNYSALGFESADEVRSAMLGTPTRVYMVRLDELQRYEQGQSDPSQLLHDTNQATVPVMVSGETRSSLTLGREGEDWRVVSVGAPEYVRLLTAQRERMAQAEGMALSEYFEVWVPALNVRFIGTVRDGSLFLTPVHDAQQFGFEAGSTLSADDALARMVTAAQNHDGLPH